MKRLILAPHCDDEVLGCGGLLAKHPEECLVAVATAPDQARLKEFKIAHEVLGYAEYIFLDFQDGNADADMRRLVGAVDQLVADYQPDEMYLPYPSMHQDHIAVYEAGARAGRLSMSEEHWFTPSLLVYDVCAYDVQLYPNDLRYNLFEELTEKQIDMKVEALRAYASQTVTGPHPVNNLKHLARVIGAQRQLDYAEQYAMIRGVRR